MSDGVVSYFQWWIFRTFLIEQDGRVWTNILPFFLEGMDCTMPVDHVGKRTCSLIAVRCGE